MVPQQEQEKIYQAAICFIIQTERDIARKLTNLLLTVYFSLEKDNSISNERPQLLYFNKVYNTGARNPIALASCVKTKHNQKPDQHAKFHSNLGKQRVQTWLDQKHHRRTKRWQQHAS